MEVVCGLVGLAEEWVPNPGWQWVLKPGIKTGPGAKLLKTVASIGSEVNRFRFQ